MDMLFETILMEIGHSDCEQTKKVQEYSFLQGFRKENITVYEAFLAAVFHCG